MKRLQRICLFSKLATYVSIVAGICFLIGCANTISVHQLPNTSPPDAIGKNGFFYTLPKSVLKITIRVKKTDVTPSVHFDLDRDRTDLQSLPYPVRFYTERDSSYELVSIAPELVAIPDTTATFFVQTKQRNNPLLEKRFNFEFDAEAGNALKSATFQSKDNLIPTLLSVAQAVIGILSVDESLPANSVAVTQPPAARLLAVQNQRRALLDKFYQNPSPSRFDPKLIEAQLKQMLQEEVLINLLRGTKTDSIYTYTLYQDVTTVNTDLFSLHKKTGFKHPAVSSTGNNVFSLSVTQSLAPTALPAWTTKMKADIDTKGIYYRIPGMARLQIIGP